MKSEQQKTQKKYTKPRAVRLGEIDEIVQSYLLKYDVKFPDLVKKSLVFYLESDRPKSEISLNEIVEELKKMRGGLSRVGGNLNQLAFSFNSSGVVREKDLQKSHEDLRKEFVVLIDFFRKFEQTLLDHKG